MDTAIGLALEYHLKQNQLVKNTSVVSKTSTQTNKSGSLFNKYSLIGSLKKDNSSSNVLGTMNSTLSSKEYNLFSLKKSYSRVKKVIVIIRAAMKRHPQLLYITRRQK